MELPADNNSAGLFLKNANRLDDQVVDTDVKKKGNRPSKAATARYLATLPPERQTLF